MPVDKLKPTKSAKSAAPKGAKPKNKPARPVVKTVKVAGMTLGLPNTRAKNPAIEKAVKIGKKPRRQ